jgi:hypothetical protein
MAYSPESRKLKYEKKKELMKSDPNFRAEANRKRQESRKRRITNRFLAIDFDVTKINTGICCYVECETKLSRYNQDYCCALHQTKVIKNGLNQIIEYDDVRGFGFKKQEL